MEITERNYTIYCIENIVNNKKYIGITCQLSDRKSQHKKHLSTGKHYNDYLQRSYNKYGKENFVFKILEKIKTNKYEASERELYWINKLKTLYTQEGYNIELGGYNGKVNKQTIEKIRNSVVENQGKSILQYDLDGNFIREWNSISEASRESKLSIQNIMCCLKYKSKRAGNYIWRYFQEDYPTKIKKHSNKLQSHQKKIIQYSLNGEFIKIWDCIGDACEFYCGDRLNGNLTAAIKRKGTAFDFQWRYFTTKYKENIGKSKRRLKKKVAKYSLDDEFICTYDSMTEGAKDVGLKSECGISGSCRNKDRIAGGFKWRWV